jgi:radical SAM protein with 4Fe4S-binding SPASM domain
LKAVNIAITGACPLRCPCCYRADDGEQLSLAELGGLAPQLAELGVETIYLGGGEPLVHPELFGILELLSGAGFQVYLATNAVLVDEAVIEALGRCLPDLVFVGLDDPAAAALTAKDPAGREAALEGLRLLQAAGIPLVVNYVVTHGNLPDLPRTLRAFRDLGLGRVNLIRPKPSRDPEWFDRHRLLAEDLRVLAELCRRLPREMGIRIALDCTLGLLLHGVPALYFVHRGIHLCNGGIDYLRIEPNGDVHPCTAFLGLTPPVGNIRESALREIWERAPLLERLRALRPPEGRCGECYLGKRCAGCRALALHVSGELGAEDPDCPFGPELIRPGS